MLEFMNGKPNASPIELFKFIGGTCSSSPAERFGVRQLNPNRAPTEMLKLIFGNLKCVSIGMFKSVDGACSRAPNESRKFINGVVLSSAARMFQFINGNVFKSTNATCEFYELRCLSQVVGAVNFPKRNFQDDHWKGFRVNSWSCQVHISKVLKFTGGTPQVLACKCLR